MPGGIGVETSGAGVALINIDTVSKLDMIVLWVNNPTGANTIYYRIAWNLDSTGTPASWSSTKSMPSSDVGSETQGAE
jgi:hypothetical protein